MAVFCTNCGAQNGDGSQICQQCHSQLPVVGASGPYQPNLSGPEPAPYSPSANDPSPHAYAPNVGSDQSGGPSAPQYQPGAALYDPQQYQYASSQPSQAGMKADPWLRLGSWMIDMLALMLCFIPLVILGLIPLIGWLIVLIGFPVIGVTYHLMRDIKGQSIGKYLLGMKVMSKTGGEAPNGSRVMRNLLFAIPSACMIVPVIGWVFGGFVAFAIMLAETITLLSSGERIGDKFANTVVVKTK